ncbi:MAG: TadE family protein, partial [Pseudonocardiales bacterium]|nr:TadE family protein [Pseudonocardiales bacterium]
MTLHRTCSPLTARWWRVVRDADRGFSTLEAVVVIPVVVVMSMIAVQFVMIWHARNVAEAAARDGLRVARGYQSSAARGKVAAEEYLTKVAPRLLSNRACDVARTAASVVIVCRADVASVVPLASYTVSERATGPVETFG